MKLTGLIVFGISTFVASCYAACSCRITDQACLERCVITTNKCIINCENRGGYCQQTCIASYWPTVASKLQSDVLIDTITSENGEVNYNDTTTTTTSTTTTTTINTASAAISSNINASNNTVSLFPSSSVVSSVPPEECPTSAVPSQPSSYIMPSNTNPTSLSGNSDVIVPTEPTDLYIKNNNVDTLLSSGASNFFYQTSMIGWLFTMGTIITLITL
ncbi:MAG: hypothetical protein EXX96DRAFT_558068 [Benjaminiella poitrasii]|nr:MAG: hypothetical protein EXX96DRAFT_558068 [Benjaminiella poitrasii]